MSEIKVNKISPVSDSGTTLFGDSGDTFTIPSGATFTNSGTATGFGGGKVLQVVQTRWDGVSSSNSTSFTATPLTSFQRTITPSATTSNIIIQGVLHLCHSTELSHLYGQMYRDTTQINMGDQLGSNRLRGSWNLKRGDNGGALVPVPFFYYDTEIATTSEVTYSFKIANNSGTAYFNQDDQGTDTATYMTTSSTLICIEIDGS